MSRATTPLDLAQRLRVSRRDVGSRLESRDALLAVVRAVNTSFDPADLAEVLRQRYAQRIAEECWALSGAEGAVYGTRWSRAVLFTRALTIGGGTTDVQLNIIGERLLGLPRDPAPGS